MNDHAVVKFGVSVTASEAANQSFAWNMLRPASPSVLVPRVYRFFQANTFLDHRRQEVVGYLVMEFVSGKRLSELPPAQLSPVIEKVAQAIQAMSRIKSTTSKPGPLDGSEPRGPVWAPDGRAYEQFKSIGDLEAWVNRALVRDNTTINLRRHPLCFCHLDLARRNVLLTDDQTICLLDWATAGFYPRILEIWNLRVTNANDTLYTQSLAGHLPPLSTEEKDAEWLLWCAYRRNVLNSLSVKERKEVMEKAAIAVPKLRDVTHTAPSVRKVIAASPQRHPQTSCYADVLRRA